MRVFVISPLRGTQAQFDEIEAEVKTCGLDDEGAFAYRKTLRADLIVANTRRAECLCLAVAQDGNAPFAPHIFCTQFLNDSIEAERDLGISIGLSWLRASDVAWVWKRDGISDGMRHEIEAAGRLGVPVVYPVTWR